MKTLKIDTIQYVNLDERADRRRHMEANLAAVRDKAERVSAVRLKNSPESQGIRMKAEHVGAASIASIFLSHMKAVETAINKCSDGAAVLLEDDCHFPRNIWSLDLGISRLPESWQLILVGQRFRAVGTPSVRPRLTMIERLNPFRQRYWAKPLQDGEGRSSKELTARFIASGAHFVIFRNVAALQCTLKAMRDIEEVYHVDRFYSERISEAYSLSSSKIFASGFGTDNRG
jgi:hypothetical protein